MPDSSTRSDLQLRKATPGDLDALERLENAVFESDRISRRSFRRFLESRTRHVILLACRDGRILGYALILFRRGTALARLYSIAVDPGAAGSGIGRRLLAAAEEEAVARDCILLRLEVREDNRSAIGLYRKTGYRQFGRHADYYADHEAALRFEKLLSGQIPQPAPAPPYYRQTLDFTCGPACVAMALAWADPSMKPSRAVELSLWRQATTIFMTSGLGGCEPYGLAVTLKKHGLSPAIHVSRKGLYFLDGVRSEEKRMVMRLTQEEFRREARELAIPTEASLSAATLEKALTTGALAIVLVSGYRMFSTKSPHWVLAWGHDGRHVFIHDPFVDPDALETPTATANLPIPAAEFQRMARYGSDALRAAILVTKDTHS